MRMRALQQSNTARHKSHGFTLLRRHCPAPLPHTKRAVRPWSRPSFSLSSPLMADTWPDSHTAFISHDHRPETASERLTNCCLLFLSSTAPAFLLFQLALPVHYPLFAAPLCGCLPSGQPAPLFSLPPCAAFSVCCRSINALPTALCRPLHQLSHLTLSHLAHFPLHHHNH